MKKSFFTLFTLFALIGCSSTELSFSPSTSLTLSEEHIALNEQTNITFPLSHNVLMPNYTGGYETNFITQQSFSVQYPAYRLMSDYMRQLPFKRPTIEFVFADKCIALRIDDDYVHWEANYIFNAEGGSIY